MRHITVHGFILYISMVTFSNCYGSIFSVANEEKVDAESKIEIDYEEKISSQNEEKIERNKNIDYEESGRKRELKSTSSNSAGIFDVEKKIIDTKIQHSKAEIYILNIYNGKKYILTINKGESNILQLNNKEYDLNLHNCLCDKKNDYDIMHSARISIRERPESVIVSDKDFSDFIEEKLDSNGYDGLITSRDRAFGIPMINDHLFALNMCY